MKMLNGTYYYDTEEVENMIESQRREAFKEGGLWAVTCIVIVFIVYSVVLIL